MAQVVHKFPGKRVLVVDDYFISQELVKEVLKLMACDVDVAEDGESAIDMFKSFSYDLIIMDMQLGDMDGRDVTRALRKMEKQGQHVPIVGLTANFEEGDKEKCLAAGMDGYLNKPIKLGDFEEYLKQFLA